MANVLVIDDDPAMREVLQLQLERLGHAVLTARGGREALEQMPAWRDRLDLVITDIFMPEGEGIEILLALRGLPEAPPVVAMSGGGRTLDGSHFLSCAGRLGAAALLHKPFSSDDLKAAVAQALGSRSAA